MHRVEQLAAAQGIQLSLSSELYLELDDSTDSCKYYILDHATRSIFWLDGGNTQELELSPVSSTDHLSKDLVFYDRI